MARPRVFVSSTYYDLKHLRSSIENFIEQLGYEAVLSEKDSIAYLPSDPLDESCYREAKSCDLFVLIIGGRYGSPASAQPKPANKEDFYERYDSITKREYDSAVEREIPTYILIDASVDAEYHTYLKNKDQKNVKYAHVDSINIFHLIESIREKQKNNPVKLFTKYSEIEGWLREQWAGTFRELIHRLSTQQKIQAIDSKVLDLTQTMETIKRYLEEVVAKVSPEKQEALKIIQDENKRLQQAKTEAELRSSRYVQHLVEHHKKSLGEVKSLLQSEGSYPSFVAKIFKAKDAPFRVPSCACSSKAFGELNEAKLTLGLEPFPDEGLGEVRANYKPRPTNNDPKEILDGLVREIALKERIAPAKKATAKKKTPGKTNESKGNA